MGVWIFFFYFAVFVVFFLSGRREGEKQNLKVVLLIPALLALLLFLLSVIKIYFIYKIILVVLTGFLLLLTYWHWGEWLRKWFK